MPARIECVRGGEACAQRFPQISPLPRARARGVAPNRMGVHLWNNELHHEGHAHCEKLIVNNEPPLAHYQNNEPTFEIRDILQCVPLSIGRVGVGPSENRGLRRRAAAATSGSTGALPRSPAGRLC